MKKRNPTDATLRNIRALKARVSKLEKQLRALEGVNLIQYDAIADEYVTRQGRFPAECLVVSGGKAYKIQRHQAVKRLEKRK